MEQEHHEIINHSQLLQQVGVDTGYVVADLGTGREGTFTMLAAEMVGQAGFVYALDVMEDALEAIRERAKRENFDNVITVWTDLEMYGAAQQVRDHTVDVAVLSDTLSQSREHEDMLREAGRMLKLHGKLLVLEWKPQPTPIGPPVEQRVQPDQIQQLAQGLGMEMVDQFEAGAYHWALILEKVSA